MSSEVLLCSEQSDVMNVVFYVQLTKAKASKFLLRF